VLRWIVIIGGGLIGLSLIVLVVGFSDCGLPDPPGLPDPIAPPERTAIQDQAVRSLMLSVGQSKLCDQLQGQLLPLPPRDAPAGREAGAAAAIGRFWIERCSAEQRDGGLSVSLDGRGWTWADETRTGPMGSRFAVQGYIKMSLSLVLRGELDLGYHEQRQIASVWLTPNRAPSARMSVIGDLPVKADTGWSGIIGILGQVVGTGIETKARPVVESFGANEIARKLTPGLTVTGELCTGQLDTFMGALANGEIPVRPYSPNGKVWLANQRVQIHPGGFDVSGPYDTGGEPLTVEIEVEQGAIVDARLYCEAQGGTVIESYLGSRPAPPLPTVVVQAVMPGRPATLVTPPSSCPLILVLTPRPSTEDTETRLRYRAVAGDGSPEALVSCGTTEP
jgi:hypothetical protein